MFKQITTAPPGESITINKTIPSKQFKDIFVTNITAKEVYPTLEEVKQEWEARDCIWKETEFDIQIISRTPTYFLKIRIFKNTRNYQGIITLEEHLLLTKTFKALRWFNG